MNLEAKLYMIFDMLGDIPRTGPLIWKVDRIRTEDIKDHTLDLIIMAEILKKHFPSYIDYDLLVNYIICHDLEEAITGDITAFQGVTKEEKERVNKIAMDYLIDTFGSVLDFKKYFIDFEENKTLEAKIAHMLDKVNGAIPFLKYDGEKLIDMNNPEVIEELRNSKAVIEGRKKYNSVGDIFFNYHMKNVIITEEERIKYNISLDDANKITNAIKKFMNGIYIESKNVKKIKSDFPKEATIYNE